MTYGTLRTLIPFFFKAIYDFELITTKNKIVTYTIVIGHFNSPMSTSNPPCKSRFSPKIVNCVPKKWYMILNSFEHTKYVRLHTVIKNYIFDEYTTSRLWANIWLNVGDGKLLITCKIQASISRQILKVMISIHDLLQTEVKLTEIRYEWKMLTTFPIAIPAYSVFNRRLQ